MYQIWKSGYRVAWMLRFALMSMLLAAAAIAQVAPLAIPPQPVRPAVIGQPYTLQLAAHGGTPLYRWRLADGSTLPPGLALDPTGLISGAATAPGTFHFRVEVADSAGPPATDSRNFVIDVPEALVIDWDRPPQASKEGITGSVIVSNQTGQTVDLTVVIVAVNATGKAFALAEQHFPLRPDSDSPKIPFGAGYVLPFGKYTIHADAVGEIAATKQIFRTRKQTAEPFVIKQ